MVSVSILMLNGNKKGLKKEFKKRECPPHQTEPTCLAATIVLSINSPSIFQATVSSLNEAAAQPVVVWFVEKGHEVQSNSIIENQPMIMSDRGLKFSDQEQCAHFSNLQNFG